MITTRRLGACAAAMCASVAVLSAAPASAAPVVAPPLSTITRTVPDDLSTGQSRSANTAATDRVAILSCQPTTDRAAYTVPVDATPADHGTPEHATYSLPGVDAALGWSFEITLWLGSRLTGRTGCVDSIDDLHYADWGATATLASGPGLTVAPGRALAILPGQNRTARPASPIVAASDTPSASPTPSSGPSCQGDVTGRVGLGSCLLTTVTPDGGDGAQQPTSATSAAEAAPPVASATRKTADEGGFGLGGWLLILLTVAAGGWSRRTSRVIALGAVDYPSGGLRATAAASGVVSAVACLAALATGPDLGLAVALTALALLPATALARAITTRPAEPELTVTTLLRTARTHIRHTAIGAVVGLAVGAVVAWPTAVPAAVLIAVAVAVARPALADADAARTVKARDDGTVADVLGIRVKTIADGEMSYTTLPGGGYRTGRLSQPARLALSDIDARCAEHAPGLYVSEASVDRVELLPVTDGVREQRAGRERGLGETVDVDPWVEPPRRTEDRVDLSKPGTRPGRIDLSDGW